MLITFEGGDGSGKDTIAKRISRVWGMRKINFPNRGSLTGREIDKQLKEGITNPLAFQALMILNRIEVLDELEEAAGHIRKHLIVVRYWQSGWVYGQLDGLPSGYLMRVQGFLPKADLNILLDVDAATARQRRIDRGEYLEHYEKQTPDVGPERLYRELWDSTPGWFKLDARKAPEEIEKEVNDLIETSLKRLTASDK